MDTDFIYALVISAIALVISYGTCNRWLRLGRRVSSVIAFGFGLIVFLYLQANPEILGNTVFLIATALIGLVTGLATFIRRIN